MDDIAVKVRSILTDQMGIDIASVGEDNRLIDIDLDSVEMVEFALLLEDAFDVAIPDEDVTPTMTVGQVCEAIRRLKA